MSKENKTGEYDVSDDPVGKLEALHDEEYRIQHVLADLVDNSIDANSTLVMVDFDDCEYPGEEKEYPFLDGSGHYILIRDNGDGIPTDRIFKALSRGHRRDYDEWELGHFGVGLKDSSFSQAYEITLFSKHKDEDGKVNILRYSSCAVKARERDIHLDPEGMVDDFAWMAETAGYVRAMEYIDSIANGTVVLLEGLHKIQGQAGTDDKSSIVHKDKVKKSCENYLRLAFEYYIREGGHDIPLSEPDPSTGKMHKHKQVEIEFNDEQLKPLDPFYRDLEDNESNYGTLTWEGTLRTPVENSEGKKLGQDVKIKIHLIPNKKNPAYLERTEPDERALQEALGVGAYFLQGFFFYRNGRLLDAAGKNPWKGVYKDIDNQKTHIRWEIHLPPGRSVGQAKKSEFRITKSKGNVKIEPRIVKELEKIAGKTAKQVWHPQDPDRPLGMGARGRIRLNKDSGEKSNKQRFGVCPLCGDYKHEKKDHKCSSCGETGSELDCCESLCVICGMRGHESLLHQCTQCGLVGHEGSCTNPRAPGPKEPGEPGEPGPPGGRQTTLLEFVMVNKVETGEPIQITYTDESSLKIDFNEKHHMFGKIIEKIKEILPPEED